MDDDDSIFGSEDDSFFDGEDDSVWPASTAGDEVSDEEDAMEVIMYSIPSTPESNANKDGEVENLGFMEEKKVEDEEREDVAEVNGVLNEVEDLKKDEEIEEIRANSVAKGSKIGEELRSKKDDEKNNEEVRVDLKDEEMNLKSNSTSKDEDMDEEIKEIRVNFAENLLNSKAEGDNVECEIVKEDEKKGEIRVNLAGKEMSLKSKSTSKDEEIEKTRVNFAATSSKLRAKSTTNVQEDKIEIETVREGDKKQESSANFAAKEPKLKSKLTLKNEDVKLNEETEKIRVAIAAKSNSNLKEDKVEIRIMKHGEKSKKIGEKNEEVKELSKKRGKKSSKSKSKSKFEEKVRMDAEECLIEMLKEMYVVDDDKDVDFMETGKRRGITFPRNRGFDS